MRTLLVALTLAGGVSAAELPEADLAALVANARKTWNAPGLAAVVVVNDRVIYLGGDGVRCAGKIDPVTADTVFPLASCTKSITALLAAAMVEDGKLGWDDPVRKHLPPFRLSDPKADGLVSVRDLFCHRLGLRDHDLLWYRAPWDLDETVLRMGRLPLDRPFRDGYAYCSLGYIAAGRMLENRSGRSYGNLLDERLGKPLGWKSMAVTSTEAAKFPDRAEGHRRTADGKIKEMPPYEMKEANAAGSLHLSARDLGQYLRFQLNRGTLDGKRIVGEKALAATTTPITPMPRTDEMKAVYPDTVQCSYAMGWVSYDHRGHAVLAHGGMIDGFRAQITLLPNANAGFALLNNLDGTRLNTALGNVLIDRLLDLPAKDWHAYYQKVESEEAEARKKATVRRALQRDPTKSPSQPLERFAGTYEHPAYGTATIAVKDGKLELTYSSFKLPLDHWEADVFRITGDGILGDELIRFAPTDAEFVGMKFRKEK